jgi:glutathione S-transferase
MTQTAILIGWNRSPYARRVGISMRIYGIPFEQKRITAWNSFDVIKQSNPIVKIPTFITEEGDCLIESAAILDYLDCRVGPERALMPPPSPLRDRVRQVMALSTAIIDKGRELRYEIHLRPQELRYEPWVERWSGQLRSAIQALDERLEEPFAAGEKLTQADVTAGCMYDMMIRMFPDLLPTGTYAALDALGERCHAMPEFQQADFEPDD